MTKLSSSRIVAFCICSLPLLAISPSSAQIKPAPPSVDSSPAPQQKSAPKPSTPDIGTTEPKKLPPSAKPSIIREGTMTLARMNEIIRRLDPAATMTGPGQWRFKISERPVLIVTDAKHNRMRIMSPVAKLAGLPQGALQRMMQANFDTALDARYAVARGIVWGTFIHPLSELHDRQFISAIGQTVNLGITFGKTFSSGAMSFGAGDSRGLLRRKLIEDLQKKGLPI